MYLQYLGMKHFQFEGNYIQKFNIAVSILCFYSLGLHFPCLCQGGEN
jgi:hypothetical protein